VRDYAVLGGWRDGVNGFIVAVMSAFSVFAKYAALRTRPGSATTAAKGSRVPSLRVSGEAW